MALDANSLRAAATVSSLNSRSRRMNSVSSFAAAAFSMPAAISSRRRRSASLARLAPRAAQLQEPELRLDVDLGDDDAAVRNDGDQPLAREPPERLADWRAAEAQALAQDRLRHDRARRDPQRDDLLLESAIGLFGEADAGRCGTRLAATPRARQRPCERGPSHDRARHRYRRR